MTCKLIASFATILELLPDPLCLKEKMQIWINQFLSLFSTMMMDSFRHLKKKKKNMLDFGTCRTIRKGTLPVCLELVLTCPPHLVLCQEGVSQVFLEEILQPLH